MFNAANLSVDRMNLYEIFISMYLQEVRHLIKKGMKSFYEGKEDNLKLYKGKLKIKRTPFKPSIKNAFMLPTSTRKIVQKIG